MLHMLANLWAVGGHTGGQITHQTKWYLLTRVTVILLLYCSVFYNCKSKNTTTSCMKFDFIYMYLLCIFMLIHFIHHT